MELTIPQLLLTLLFLAPGFIGFKVLLIKGKVHDEFDRFDKAASSLILSAFSVLAIYGIYSIGLGEFRGYETFSLLEITVGYFSQISFALIAGYSVGKMYEKFSDGENMLQSPMTLFIENMSGDKKSIIHLESGEIIQGFLVGWDDKYTEENIILKFPKKIELYQGKIISKSSLGKYGYLSGKDVSRIFTDKDIIYRSEEL